MDSIEDTVKVSEEFFTQDERNTVLAALGELSDVDIKILSRDNNKITLSNLSDLSDRSAFFAKAKLWRVIETIIREVYLDKLIDRELHFKDRNGIYYTVMPSKINLVKGE